MLLCSSGASKSQTLNSKQNQMVFVYICALSKQGFHFIDLRTKIKFEVQYLTMDTGINL
jgi:hypothetical protein